MGIVIGHGRRVVIRLPDLPLQQRERALPLEARLAMFLLEAQAEDSHALCESASLHRRQDERLSCRFPAAILHSVEQSSMNPSSIFIRDISTGHAGFICRAPLAANDAEACWLQLDQADGTTVTLRGHIARCREFQSGWYEGVIRFDLEPEEAEQIESREPELRIAV
jgi:hypothetical protein